jgi:hypothetical protein
MFRGLACAFWTLAVVTLLSHPTDGQSVISTRSGVVHYSEGAVYLGNQPLEYHPGKFSSVPEGGELRTDQGRAEVLLTPGTFVRIGDGSSIRMLESKLSDTRVELLSGSAVVDSAAPSPGTSVTLIYKNWSVRFLQQGLYRIDSNPPRLWVLRGKAEVSAGGNKNPVSIAQGMYVSFAPVLAPKRSIDEPHDAFSAWAEGRQESILADNAIAANIQDPASLNSSISVDNFTYYPMLGLPSISSSSVGPDVSNYDPYLNLYQPGFNSLYLPGYSYLPLIVVLGRNGFPSSHLPLPPAGVAPFGISHAPVPLGLTHVTGPRPVGVSAFPPHQAPMRSLGPHTFPHAPAARGGGVHGGVHR